MTPTGPDKRTCDECGKVIFGPRVAFAPSKIICSECYAENAGYPSLAKRTRAVIAKSLVEIDQEHSTLTPDERASLIVIRLIEHGYDVTELPADAM